MTFTLEIVDVIRKNTGSFDENSNEDCDVKFLTATSQETVKFNKNYELLILR